MTSGSTTYKNGDVMAIDPALSIYIELNRTDSDFLLFKKNDLAYIRV
ncbi:MAG: hypothetical protein JGK24_09020 [Microcoleus sp. PH2017_29_MFU_D_A]|jgi:hypothetical protein|nr:MULTISPECIES: hypothetical protein [unclassified Microcoleus]MCC3420065.1 hypothetical protein [Microcoleus sp. PH2017_07_MST_O_A]MCC3440491.1 hypothetical protein [Microcoleus sp. PH2017_03_ELD_O_A]MCC3465854.1 hypothetical protein [Microcoleus sp. PH2017_06_SFM_O_A]MCC3504180.1 hypothetical protein [Microcoleus sp. PH2017_19_SFW_U_A]MCC3508485.1 hypothetical protein [Microcoleus sp. PH2017_17_BER_D_A]MCC3641017.1 hypothetical protein [Microcoleus sp. PH2017_33_LGB_O_A]